MENIIKTRLREFFNKRKKEAVGILIKSEETNRVLLLLRNDKKPTWSLLSGNIDSGETPIQTIRREMLEEISIDYKILTKIKEVGSELNDVDNLIFHYFEGFTLKEFTPKLNNENLKWGWFSLKDLPSPLYNNMLPKIKNII